MDGRTKHTVSMDEASQRHAAGALVEVRLTVVVLSILHSSVHVLLRSFASLEYACVHAYASPCTLARAARRDSFIVRFSPGKARLAHGFAWQDAGQVPRAWALNLDAWLGPQAGACLLCVVSFKSCSVVYYHAAQPMRDALVLRKEASCDALQRRNIKRYKQLYGTIRADCLRTQERGFG